VAFNYSPNVRIHDVALAAPTSCSGFFPAGSYQDVVVTNGNTCTMGAVAGATTISGNVTVQAGGTLDITASSGDVIVKGSVQGQKGCNFVEVDYGGSGSTSISIGGNLNIDSCSSGFNGCRAAVSAPPPTTVLIGGDFTCVNSGGNNECVTDRCTIAGNLNCSGNSGGCVVPETTIGKSATLQNNADAGASINNSVIGGNLTIKNNSSGFVTDNEISGNLSCSGNGADTHNSGNAVAGKTSCL
jgi:hypothetical protein